MLTVEQIINIGKVSQFLTGNHIAKYGLWGSGLDLRRPRLLYMVRKNVEWMYNLDSDNDTLIKTANYLYAISWHNLRALSILNIAGGGGTVAPISPVGSDLPNPLDFIVDATSTPILVGETTVTLSQFIGYNVEFYRGGQPQYTTNPGDGSTYYSWNRVTGELTIYTAAVLNEPMRIVPVGGFALDSTAISEQRQPIFVVVGLSASAPTAGTNTWQNNNFANAYVMLFKNGTPVASSDPGNNDPYITKALNSDTITITNYTWTADDQLFVMITVP